MALEPDDFNELKQLVRSIWEEKKRIIISLMEQKDKLPTFVQLNINSQIKSQGDEISKLKDIADDIDNINKSKPDKKLTLNDINIMIAELKVHKRDKKEDEIMSNTLGQQLIRFHHLFKGNEGSKNLEASPEAQALLNNKQPNKTSNKLFDDDEISELSNDDSYDDSEFDYNSYDENISSTATPRAHEQQKNKNKGQIFDVSFGNRSSLSNASSSPKFSHSSSHPTIANIESIIINKYNTIAKSGNEYQTGYQEPKIEANKIQLAFPTDSSAEAFFKQMANEDPNRTFNIRRDGEIIFRIEAGQIYSGDEARKRATKEPVTPSGASSSSPTPPTATSPAGSTAPPPPSSSATSSSTVSSKAELSGFAKILADNTQTIIDALRAEADAKKSGAWLTSTGYINQPGQFKEHNLIKGQKIVDAFKAAPTDPIKIQALVDYHNEISSHKLKNAIGNAVITASVIGTIAGTSGVGLVGLGLVPMSALLAPTLAAIGTTLNVTVIPAFGAIPGIKMAGVFLSFGMGAALGYARKGMERAYDWNEASYNKAVAALEETIKTHEKIPAKKELVDAAKEMLEHVKLLKLSGHKGIHLSNLAETLRVVDLQLKNDKPDLKNKEWPVLDAATTMQKEMRKLGAPGRALASVWGALTYKNVERVASVAIPVGLIATGGIAAFAQVSSSLASTSSSATISQQASLAAQHATALLYKAVPLIGGSMALHAVTTSLSTAGELTATFDPNSKQAGCYVRMLDKEPTANEKKTVNSNSEIVVYKKDNEYVVGFNKGRFFGSYAEQTVKDKSELYGILEKMHAETQKMQAGTHMPNGNDIVTFNQFLKKNGAMSRVQPPSLNEFVKKYAEDLATKDGLKDLQTSFDDLKNKLRKNVTGAAATPAATGAGTPPPKPPRLVAENQSIGNSAANETSQSASTTTNRTADDSSKNTQSSLKQQFSDMKKNAPTPNETTSSSNSRDNGCKPL